MGCCVNGGLRNEQNNQAISPLVMSEQTMYQWIAAMPDWVSIGDCACNPPKTAYRNKTYPSLELRISKDQNTFQMRLLRNSIDSKTVWQAGRLNFDFVYNLHINEQQWKNALT
jgi:hypothetical protein